jgi:hypothetical protein
MSDKTYASSRDEPQALWLALPVQPPVTADQIRRRVVAFANWKRRRAVGAASIVVIGVGQAVASALLRGRPLAAWEWAGVAYLVTVAGAIVWAALAARPRVSSAMEGAECARAYRSLLEQERDTVQGRALAVRVAIPFGLIIQAGLISMKLISGFAFWPFATAAFVVSGVIWRRGTGRARLLQMHIDAVDKSQRDSPPAP